MKPKSSNASKIAGYSFLVAFANDGTLDATELARFEELALSDGIVDDEEKLVLRKVFARVAEDRVTPEVWDEIQAFRAKHGID
jgi:tellurite resistance protein